jgi:superfamily I DNA/RNA helicase
MLAYLDKLNPDQRRAVEHGICDPATHTALLVIAGAGSGKTSTLAHRVVHLAANGRRSPPYPPGDVLAARRRRDDAAGPADRQ